MHGNPPSPVSMPTSLGVPFSATGSSTASSPVFVVSPTSVVSADYHIHQAHPALDMQNVIVEPDNEQQSDIPIVEPSGYFRVKTILDRMITAVLMIIALPLMLLVGLAVLVCQGRPIFFRQVRVGKDGYQFRIWKFRTMQNDAELRTGAVWSNASDTRVTKLGRWLRCSHLDELPQFINVLCGEMSLVGPRPERPEFVEPLSEQVAGYANRTLVRPGITGNAQLRLGYDESFAGIPAKVACDLDYIRQASCLGDLRLLASTLPYIVRQIHYKWLQNRVKDNSPLNRRKPVFSIKVASRTWGRRQTRPPTRSAPRTTNEVA